MTSGLIWQAAQCDKRERFLRHHQTLFLDAAADACWLDGWLRAGGRAVFLNAAAVGAISHRRHSRAL